MNDSDQAHERFKQAVGKFLLTVQTGKTIDPQGFQEIDVQARLLARLLKENELISKSLLNEFHTAAKVLRAEAPFFSGQSAMLVNIAEQLELTFDLILLGECHSDRVPGVPRVI